MGKLIPCFCQINLYKRSRYFQMQSCSFRNHFQIWNTGTVKCRGTETIGKDVKHEKKNIKNSHSCSMFISKANLPLKMVKVTQFIVGVIKILTNDGQNIIDLGSVRFLSIYTALRWLRFTNDVLRHALSGRSNRSIIGVRWIFCVSFVCNLCYFCTKREIWRQT